MFTRRSNLPPHGSEVSNRLTKKLPASEVWGRPPGLRKPLVVASVTVQWEWSADQAPWLVHFSDHPTGDREVKARWLSKCSHETTTKIRKKPTVVGVQRAWPAFQEGAHRLGDPAKARERDSEGTTWLERQPFASRMTRGAVNKGLKSGYGKDRVSVYSIVLQ